ncbi:HHIP-like protein 2 [Branchiostoma lanceolatum]|uniref:HHIP-like protein 2 n=1 Tax=Branchiostoma lanceolatum TaxID=7740 RepID=UPI0034542370
MPVMCAVLFLLLACSQATSGAKDCSTSATSSTPGCLCLQEVVGGLKNPLAMLQPDDGTKRFFLVEQIGLIRVTDSSGRLLAQPFLNITSKVLTSDRPGDERGLLGAVLHPQFAQNGYFYLYYSTREGGSNVGGGHKSVVARLQVSDDKNQADPSSESVLMEIAQPGDGNNGGQLLFGADGYLYVSVGDGGAGAHTAGNTSSLLGKVLRIDVNTADSGRPYSVPSDNPFVGQADARPEVYAYGFKNPWRCSVDKGDKEGVGQGRVFCGDVGNSSYEEISIISKGGNHGWPDREGHTCQNPSGCDDGHIPPVHVYSHDEGIAVIGGPVYRGCNVPSLRGKYLYADYTGKLFYLREQRNGTWTNAALCVGNNTVCKTSSQQSWGAGHHFILGFGQDVSGEAYLLTTLNPTASQPLGKVFKFVDPDSTVSGAPVLQVSALLLLTAILIMKSFI